MHGNPEHLAEGSREDCGIRNRGQSRDRMQLDNSQPGAPSVWAALLACGVPTPALGWLPPTIPQREKGLRSLPCPTRGGEEGQAASDCCQVVTESLPVPLRSLFKNLVSASTLPNPGRWLLALSAEMKGEAPTVGWRGGGRPTPLRETPGVGVRHRSPVGGACDAGKPHTTLFLKATC